MNKIPMVSNDGPRWDQEVRRIVRSAFRFKAIADHSFASGTNQKIRYTPFL